MSAGSARPRDYRPYRAHNTPAHPAKGLGGEDGWLRARWLRAPTAVEFFRGRGVLAWVDVFHNPPPPRLPSLSIPRPANAEHISPGLSYFLRCPQKRGPHFLTCDLTKWPRPGNRSAARFALRAHGCVCLCTHLLDFVQWFLQFALQAVQGLPEDGGDDVQGRLEEIIPGVGVQLEVANLNASHWIEFQLESHGVRAGLWGPWIGWRVWTRMAPKEFWDVKPRPALLEGSTRGPL